MVPVRKNIPKNIRRKCQFPGHGLKKGERLGRAALVSILNSKRAPNSSKLKEEKAKRETRILGSRQEGLRGPLPDTPDIQQRNAADACDCD